MARAGRAATASAFKSAAQVVRKAAISGIEVMRALSAAGRAGLSTGGRRYHHGVSWVAVVLLACALLVLAAAEWPRLERRIGLDARRRRERARRKASFKVLKSESDEFAASVQRDLEKLPTIEREERR